jgi:hypothetical protein
MGEEGALRHSGRPRSFILFSHGDGGSINGCAESQGWREKQERRHVGLSHVYVYTTASKRGTGDGRNIRPVLHCIALKQEAINDVLV